MWPFVVAVVVCFLVLVVCSDVKCFIQVFVLQSPDVEFSVGDFELRLLSKRTPSDSDEEDELAPGEQPQPAVVVEKLQPLTLQEGADAMFVARVAGRPMPKVSVS